MKKSLCIATCILFVASLANAVQFSPTPMKITAPSHVQYNFDGTELKIPVTVSGKPALALLCIYTKGMAANIIKVQNGFLGWHYVNKIDTSVYISSVIPTEVGSNSVKWNGKDDDGKLVPAGEYTYYIWGFDNTSQKIIVNRFMYYGGWCGSMVTIQETGPDDESLANPIIYMSGGTQKWIIGSDPADSTFLETTTYDLGPGFVAAPAVVFQPGDFSKFFIRVGSKDTSVHGIRKMNLVPNGVSTFDTGWGDNGMASWTQPSAGSIHGGPERIDDYIFATDNGYQTSPEAVSNFYYISLDEGEVVKEKDMSDWWSSSEDLEKGGKMNRGPGGIVARGKYIFLNSHSSCIKQMVEPLAEDEEDFYVWTNQNGDYVLDYHSEPDSPKPWVCADFVSPFTYHLSADTNLFSITSAYDMGAVSFGLLAPDGDGIGYLAYAGETATWKIYNHMVDSGSAFDGIYSDNQASSNSIWPVPAEETVLGVWYVGQDSFKGIISSKPVAVDESAPSAFSVAQNSPNPFNPTTTIGFAIPEAGTVSIEVYNVAGQKVDTIANGFMAAGKHSVNWDASGFSAGVYFYTVKAGDFARTMKMTLLK